MTVISIMGRIMPIIWIRNIIMTIICQIRKNNANNDHKKQNTDNSLQKKKRRMTII